MTSTKPSLKIYRKVVQKQETDGGDLPYKEFQDASIPCTNLGNLGDIYIVTKPGQFALYGKVDAGWTKWSGPENEYLPYVHHPMLQRHVLRCIPDLGVIGWRTIKIPPSATATEYSSDAIMVETAVYNREQKRMRKYEADQARKKNGNVSGASGHEASTRLRLSPVAASGYTVPGHEIPPYSNPSYGAVPYITQCYGLLGYSTFLNHSTIPQQLSLFPRSSAASKNGVSSGYLLPDTQLVSPPSAQRIASCVSSYAPENGVSSLGTLSQDHVSEPHSGPPYENGSPSLNSTIRTIVSSSRIFPSSNIFTVGTSEPNDLDMDCDEKTLSNPFSETAPVLDNINNSSALSVATPCENNCPVSQQNIVLNSEPLDGSNSSGPLLDDFDYTRISLPFEAYVAGILRSPKQLRKAVQCPKGISNVPYIEYHDEGVPCENIGKLGDIYIDITPRKFALYGKVEAGWRKWAGPESLYRPLLYHPTLSGHVLWCAADVGVIGWREKGVKQSLDTVNTDYASASIMVEKALHNRYQKTYRRYRLRFLKCSKPINTSTCTSMVIHIPPMLVPETSSEALTTLGPSAVSEPIHGSAKEISNTVTYTIAIPVQNLLNSPVSTSEQSITANSWQQSASDISSNNVPQNGILVSRRPFPDIRISLPSHNHVDEAQGQGHAARTYTDSSTFLPVAHITERRSASNENQGDILQQNVMLIAQKVQEVEMRRVEAERQMKILEEELKDERGIRMNVDEALEGILREIRDISKELNRLKASIMDEDITPKNLSNVEFKVDIETNYRWSQMDLDVSLPQELSNSYKARFSHTLFIDEVNSSINTLRASDYTETEDRISALPHDIDDALTKTESSDVKTETNVEILSDDQLSAVFKQTREGKICTICLSEYDEEVYFELPLFSEPSRDELRAALEDHCVTRYDDILDLLQDLTEEDLKMLI